MARRRRKQQQDNSGCGVIVMAGIFCVSAFVGVQERHPGALILALLMAGLLALWWYVNGEGGPRTTTPSGDWQRTTAPAHQRTTRCVYMLRAGPYYKIGKTNNFARRRKEIALQLPFDAQVVHTIATDDETALEAYWHRRFAHRRANGEWFELTEDEAAEFTQQTEMYRHAEGMHRA